MKKGDKIIWDSRFGYDLGYFVGKSNIYHHHSVRLVTNDWAIRLDSDSSVSKNEVYPYTKELHEQMKEKYDYEKNFPRTD